jgi:hypothetical protein
MGTEAGRPAGAPLAQQQNVSLFRNPRFTAACGAVAMALFALLGFIFLMTQYFQVVKSYSPLSTGVRLLPLAAAVVVTSVAGTRLASPLPCRMDNMRAVSSRMLSRYQRK